VVQSSGNNINDSLIRTITLNAILFLIVVLVFVGFNHSNRRRTKLLLHSSYHDQLTGLKNRRAYEETIAGLSMEKMKNDFVFIIADINGLKKSNDNIGHLAGDEMIMGAADCLRMAFGENADIFRIGGDEFAVILRTDEKQLKKYLASLKKHSNAWRGEIVEGLSMSVGYIAQWDNQDKTLHEMINEADKKMYDDKKAFYSNLENE
ncbi:MAG: GGDEF domain-containing protein, partial [Erysipelotrichaceae bacterium]|nr:GGDEF domain-containing protein [Erysipelotrichaceae bacterium]